jgi:uncharacterized membrane protein
MRYSAAYGAALAAFLGLDASWLGLIARRLHRHEIGALLLAQGRIAPAACFYLLYVAGLTVFVLAPALERGGLGRAAGLDGLFGLVAYGAYDLTNLATLKGFTTVLAAADLAWGALATAIAASIGYAAGRAIGAPSPAASAPASG